MSKVATLEELFLDEIRDLYDAEKQLTKALPKMSKAACSLELRETIDEHLGQTENQVARLERIFALVGEDVKGLAKTTEKTAKDIGHAAVDVANKAGDGLQDATNKAGAGGQDAWITTKVKSALTSEGIDPLHVHVDTEGKVVTLSGSVDSASKRDKAQAVARGIAGVVDVKNHLFVKPDER